jgi:serine/threonine protein kinase
VSTPAHVLGKRFGPFTLERVLGRGRMGVVYLARDEGLLRPTALKVLSWMMPKHEGVSPEAWFLSEARSMARINHPNVVQIYGVGKHEAYRYIAMEYVAGEPAETLVARLGPMSPERATEVLAQAAAALAATHEAGVLHCDVKPENLLVSTGGTTKLGDFGMARHLPSKVGEREAVRAGTPFYTAVRWKVRTSTRSGKRTCISPFPTLRRSWRTPPPVAGTSFAVAWQSPQEIALPRRRRSPGKPFRSSESDCPLLG